MVPPPVARRVNTARLEPPRSAFCQPEPARRAATHDPGTLPTRPIHSWAAPVQRAASATAVHSQWARCTGGQSHPSVPEHVGQGRPPQLSMPTRDAGAQRSPRTKPASLITATSNIAGRRWHTPPDRSQESRRGAQGNAGAGGRPGTGSPGSFVHEPTADTPEERPARMLLRPSLDHVRPVPTRCRGRDRAAIRPWGHGVALWPPPYGQWPR